MFLVLNTAGMTLIPVSVIAQRAILAPRILGHLHSDAHRDLRRHARGAHRRGPAPAHPPRRPGRARVARRPHRVPAGVIWYFTVFLTREQIQLVSNVVGNLLILSDHRRLHRGRALPRANVYEVFIEGAKGGIQTSLMIIPFLVGMLVAIGVLRNSGVLDLLVGLVAWCIGALG
jgi:hypothetical protein